MTIEGMSVSIIGMPQNNFDLSPPSILVRIIHAVLASQMVQSDHFFKVDTRFHCAVLVQVKKTFCKQSNLEKYLLNATKSKRCKYEKL